MNIRIMLFLLLMGFCGGLIAAAMTFIISYEEFAKHFPNKKGPTQLALQTAFATFIFIFSLVLIISIFIINFIN